MKKILLMLMLVSSFVYSQKKEKRMKDFDYEVKHRMLPWFENMRDGANYFEVKKNFETYFGKREWESSKARSIGQDWLKEKLFYLDVNGYVQPQPKIEQITQFNAPLNVYAATTTSTIGSWDLIGPVNSSETGLSIKGNHGGYVSLNRIDPTNTSKRFVSFVTGGLWMSADAGTNWTLVDSNLPDDSYLDLDVVFSSPQVVYAISKRQVVKSTDGGLNWLSTSMNNGNYSGSGYDIAVSPTNPDIVLARWDNQIYRTTNGGTTWTSVLSGLSNHELMDSSITSEMLDWSTTNNTVVYSLSTSHNNQVKVHRSDDSGATFSLITTLTLDPSANGQVVGWAKLMLPTTNASSIYVAVGSGDNPRGHKAVHLYKLNATTGATENVKTNMVDGLGDPFFHDPALHHGDICMDRNDENKIVYGSYSGARIFISSNNGDSFTLSAGSTHPDIRSVDVINNLYMVGSDGEAVDSNDSGATLRTITNSISNHELWGFGSAFKSNLVASGNNHGPAMVKESANGFDWYNGGGADQGNTDVNPLDDRYIYSQGYSNYRYFRTGVHALENEANLLDLGGIYSYFNSMEFHPNSYYTIISHHAGQYPTGNPNLDTWRRSLIKSEDNGNSISIVKTFTNQVFREKISMKNPDHMYVVEGLANNRLWHTSDAGATWTDITPSVTESSGQTNISDIAVGDENPNEIWVTYSGVQSVCKILKSNDYGATWTNLTQAVLTDHPMTKIVFQRGSNGGVYVGNKSGVYYRNNSMGNWERLGSGLPMADIRFMFINYNENKLKIGTSRGAFAHELYEVSPPNALISASEVKVTCPAAGAVRFKDYSVVRNALATWSWSFEGGTPSTSTDENPEVSYENALDGFYDVTLTVTDAFGTSTQTLTDFIEVSNQCGDSSTPDPLPGNVASLTSYNNDYITVEGLNLNQNSFTFSCWIKPNGLQGNFSSIFSAQGVSSSGFTLNFMDSNNTIGYYPTWWWSTGLQAPPGQWSHVALVSNGTDVRIYVNGEEAIDPFGLSSGAFSIIDLGRYGNGRFDRHVDLEMDEVCIWNRPLSKDEIRAWRHLTKTNTSDPIFTGLVAYYQFNEIVGNVSINKASSSSSASYQGTSGSSHPVSTAPIFEGLSQKMLVDSGGTKDFTNVGLSMTFPSGGTYPNGDVWVFKSMANPDILPDLATDFNSFTIVNNYGTNKTFTPLESISFTDNSEYISTAANMYNLYKRESNDFGSTWGAKIDTGDAISGAPGASTVVTFSNGLSIDSFSQFVLSNDSGTLSTTDVEKDKPIIYPNPILNDGQLTIVLNPEWDNASMDIYNIVGQKVSHVSLKAGKNQIMINLSAGVYVVNIHDQTRSYSEKITLK